MNYITRSISGINIDGVKEYPYGLRQYINMLCVKNYSTFEGRQDAVRIQTGILRNTPIYVNSDMLLMPNSSIRCSDCVFINIHQVIGVEARNQGTRVLFLDQSHVDVPQSIQNLKRRISQIETHFVQQK